MKEVILLLGSNLGDTEKNIDEAIIKLEKDVGKVIKKSKKIKTLPVEFVSSYVFCNIAIIFETEYSPMRLLDRLKKIEEEMGRNEDSKAFGEYKDRVIDIDIVVYDGIVFKSKRLDIPHYKHLYDRDFSKELLKELNCLEIN
ncbi:MAG: 2-amino-4-hydroxy-6-hydroxymethyldihydropteridine diphosphokinase [Flavobacteriaceae bacterium]|nr:2-amino-4-hydroxy-6-hydroxymethyldihydropteridine diphosphokinase [Flavobacteriaceae bacterium]